MAFLLWFSAWSRARAFPRSAPSHSALLLLPAPQSRCAAAADLAHAPGATWSTRSALVEAKRAAGILYGPPDGGNSTMTNERPPSPKVEEPEWARAIVIGATGSIPVAGSLLAAALDEVWVPRARERVQSFLQDVDQRLQALERKNDFSAERLRHDTDFLDYA